MITSLHVICGWPPSMKNPGYAYDLVRYDLLSDCQFGFRKIPSQTLQSIRFIVKFLVILIKVCTLAESF